MTATKAAAVPPKHIPVNGQPIKARAAQQALHSIVYGTVIGLVAAGLYYGITQVDWYVHLGPAYFHIFYLKPWWDHALGTWLARHVWFITTSNWPAYRHSVARNLAEPAAAGVAVMSLLAPARYWKTRLTRARLALTLTGFPVIYLVLAAGGTWLILYGQPRFSPSGFSHGLWTVAQYAILGLVISQVLHRVFGPVGARVQGAWVERAVDHHHARARRGMPWWVRWPVVAPSIRERGQQQLDADRASGEAARLALAGTSARARSAVAYWLAGLAGLILLGVAFLGGVGHIWVGVLGHSFPYLAP